MGKASWLEPYHQDWCHPYYKKTHTHGYAALAHPSRGPMESQYLQHQATQLWFLVLAMEKRIPLWVVDAVMCVGGKGFSTP